jgi:hypothetical protein
MVVPTASAFASAVSGMAGAGRQFDAAAYNVANVSTDPFAPLAADGTQGPAGSDDFATDMVDANELAPAAYTANAKVAEISDEAYRSLLDIKA